MRFQHTDRFGDTITIDGSAITIGDKTIVITKSEAQALADAIEGERECEGPLLWFPHDPTYHDGEICIADSDPAVIIPSDVRDHLIALLRAIGGEDLQDLKPRGVKRQWWLFPFDALDEVLAADVVRLVSNLAADASKIPGYTHGALLDLADDLGGLRPATEAVCQVLEHGAAKYSPDNWRTAAGDLRAFRREYFSAIIRHESANASGEKIDPESGLPHLAHAVCNGLFWTWHEIPAARRLGSGAFQ